MQVALPEQQVPARIVYDTAGGVSQEDYLAFCRANPNLRCERTSEGEIVIAPPVGLESSYRNERLTVQLGNWAQKDGRGKAFDSSAEFLLADGSAYGPDAAWVSHESLRKLSREQRKEFPRLCPEFVVEVMSPSDRLKSAKEKMERWIANGCKLGWLIDPDQQIVYVYRPRRSVKVCRAVQELAGEGPVQGFILDLRPIWAGLG
ncbi:MAG: Uma2 family endonuclease [Bryobacterales bacterium]|nr:Uma2 family endonuclease [Bryobacterales bacterium]MBV9399313.1 Uma2 family endonuclease [Bryobacterales bacterium]